MMAEWMLDKGLGLIAFLLMVNVLLLARRQRDGACRRSC